MRYVSGEKADEFSTPFEVEEVDDVCSGSKGLVVQEEVYGETDITCSGNEGQKTRQPQENITHFEEVTEAGDLEGEQSYLVSTPDEYPGGHERDEGPVYGQIDQLTHRVSLSSILEGMWTLFQSGCTNFFLAQPYSLTSHCSTPHQHLVSSDLPGLMVG